MEVRKNQRQRKIIKRNQTHYNECWPVHKTRQDSEISTLYSRQGHYWLKARFGWHLVWDEVS